MEPKSRGNGNGIIEKRRRAISIILTERPTISQREIMDILAEQFSLWNPQTDAPYSLGTINNDIQQIKAGWMERAYRAYGDWVAEQVATIERVKEKAFRDGRLDIVLRCVEQICKLLGLYEPTRFVIDWQQEAREAGLDPSDVFERYVQAAATALAADTETA